MARKETFITMNDDNRDKGKLFYIQEMPASQAEWWAIRALMAMGREGLSIPDNFRDLGMAALAVVGLKAISRIAPDEARPLLDELMGCVQMVPNQVDKKIKRELIDSDIEEIVTRLKLRAEVLKLHVDFFKTADQS
ncbi:MULTISPECIES: hypothetical protein [Photorhabdus]|uniref:Photorhabdus luminescens subsp. laumondii TTO1 complete genome segment 12/17 n=1 Tax=Photorhabdus laumondii subsp. laumondii (strain DSM 15139 / CIP 105565 / TT01) TaxID=243265 RepID=Q7N1S6_PHOLL|nr:hypothetical protein [Photorhabdus laumondii]AWK43064.1 hypothetical protein A4R40_16920 [Photorhabdus laumondii subsp. laumondii]AXG48377.1 hypothetical protein PluTT01m_17455 [Photorhabdus laumondii subsp. laumondii]CAE15767.1 unnamed protein product [Photorhabdus laumondii subsp. laumondii TTO1]